MNNLVMFILEYLNNFGNFGNVHLTEVVWCHDDTISIIQFYFHFSEKNIKTHNSMESRPKRKFISSRDQEQLMQ